MIKIFQDLLSRLHALNVVYTEIKFCPHLHTLEGLSLDQVVEALSRGNKITFLLGVGFEPTHSYEYQSLNLTP